MHNNIYEWLLIYSYIQSKFIMLEKCMYNNRSELKMDKYNMKNLRHWYEANRKRRKESTTGIHDTSKTYKNTLIYETSKNKQREAIVINATMFIVYCKIISFLRVTMTQINTRYVIYKWGKIPNWIPYTLTS